MIVKTGSLDLQVPHTTLRTAVNRVTGVAVGLGGYIAVSKTSYDDVSPTAQITIRVPVGSFESAITQLERMPGVKVLGDSENGSDVTGQYTNLQAQMQAATTERDSLLRLLARRQQPRRHPPAARSHRRGEFDDRPVTRARSTCSRTRRRSRRSRSPSRRSPCR